MACTQCLSSTLSYYKWEMELQLIQIDMKFNSYNEEASKSKVDQGMNHDGDAAGAEIAKFHTSMASG